MAKEFSVCIPVETECLQENLVSIKEEVCIKEEIEWEPEDNAALAELYAGHNVKGEIVLGPETVQSPEVSFATYSSSDTSHIELDTHTNTQHEDISKLRTCVVKLEYEEVMLHKCNLCQKIFEDNPSLTVHMQTHNEKEKKIKMLKKPKYAEKGPSSLTEFSDYLIPKTKCNVNQEISFTSPFHTEQSNFKKNNKLKIKTEKQFEKTNNTEKCTGESVSNVNNQTNEATGLANIKENNPKLKSEKHSEDENAKIMHQSGFNINNQTKEETDPQANIKKNKKIKSAIHSENEDQAPKRASDSKLKIKSQTTEKANHKETKPYTCQICKKMFSKELNLTRHIRTLHIALKPHKCNICNKQFARIDYLRTHERVHSKQKMYTCEYCYKKFTDNSNFNKHKRFHLGVKRYTCEYCGKQFGQAIHLTTHQLTHTGKRLYICKTCHKEFTYKHRLEAHKRLHIGRKPYSCQLCTKRFIAQCRLSRHGILVHKMKLAFSCDLCLKQYKKKVGLIKHMTNSH